MPDLMILMTSLRLQQAFAQQRSERAGSGDAAEFAASAAGDCRGELRGDGSPRRRFGWRGVLGGLLAIIALQIVCR